MKTATKRGLGIAGVALAATMAAGAAAYLYMGKNAPQRRKKAAAWMKSAERDIVSQAKKLKNATLSESNYRRVIQGVANKYRQARNIDPDDVRSFVNMMMASWEKAGRMARANVKSAAKTARKARAKMIKRN